MLHIQLIDKQPPAFRLLINGIECSFYPPKTLFVPWQLLAVNAVVKGSTLGFNLKGQFISYNQIKKAIKMKKLLFLLTPILVTAQPKKNFWLKQSASASTMFVSGWLHGTNEVATHDYRRYAVRHPNANLQWSNPKLSFRNKYKQWPTDMRAKYWGSKTVLAWTTDAYHLRSTLKNALIAGNIGITLTLYEKPNWKHIIFQAVGSWACYAVGTGLAHAYYKKVD